MKKKTTKTRNKRERESVKSNPRVQAHFGSSTTKALSYFFFTFSNFLNTLRVSVYKSKEMQQKPNFATCHHVQSTNKTPNIKNWKYSQQT